MLNRRAFCTLAVGCAVAACTTGDGGIVQIGPLGDDDDDAPAPDAAAADASTAQACGSGIVDVGAPSAFALATPVLFNAKNFYVVRDEGGLYALSSRCTHQNAVNQVVSGNFRCPRHFAKFTFNGEIISGPVTRQLVHFAMCVMPSGHVGVDPATITSSTDRLIA